MYMFLGKLTFSPPGVPAGLAVSNAVDFSQLASSA
jgi:hypothetical protein